MLLLMFIQEEQAGVELRNRYMNMMRSNSQDRNSDTRSIKATWVPTRFWRSLSWNKVDCNAEQCQSLTQTKSLLLKSLNFYSTLCRTSVHPPIHQFHRPYSHQSQTVSKHESHDRHSVGQISENMEYNDDRKYSISGKFLQKSILASFEKNFHETHETFSERKSWFSVLLTFFFHQPIFLLHSNATHK